MVVGGESALAGAVACGDTITADTTLESDLIDCPNNGIIIGADNITLDLNGHIVDGDDVLVDSCPKNDVCDVGVLNDGHNGVTITGGSVTQFAVGVLAARVSDNRLLGISSSRNQFAGLGFFRATRSLVRNSSVSSSARPRRGPGLFLVASDHVRVLNSSFRNNGDQGIFVGDSDHNLIKGNLFTHNRFYGVVLEGADRNRVRGNRSVRDGQVGFYVAPGDRNVIVGNRVSHSRGLAIEVDGGDDNVIAGNSARDTRGDAILVGCPRCPVLAGTVVRRSYIRGAGEDGIHLDARTKDTIIRRNHVFDAKEDGIDVLSPSTKLTRNEARRNHDLGIQAAEGVIDGGGNRASGNGDPRQCLNITCN
jgi:parallel beta-helix repeat protein